MKLVELLPLLPEEFVLIRKAMLGEKKDHVVECSKNSMKDLEFLNVIENRVEPLEIKSYAEYFSFIVGVTDDEEEWQEYERLGDRTCVIFSV